MQQKYKEKIQEVVVVWGGGVWYRVLLRAPQEAIIAHNDPIYQVALLHVSLSPKLLLKSFKEKSCVTQWRAKL